MILLSLPFPPSIWDLHRRDRHRTKRYLAWLRAAGNEILATPVHARLPIVGPYSMVLLLADARRWHKNGNRKKIDATNFFKAPEDLLVTHGLVEDDHLGEQSAVTWSTTVPDHYCKIYVWPWDAERAAIAALPPESARQGEAA